MFENSPYFGRVNRLNIADSVADKVIEIDNTKYSYAYPPDDSKKIKLSLLSYKSVDDLVKREAVSEAASFNPTKNLNTVVVKATGLGLAANVVVSYLSNNYNMGYLAESFAYSAYFTYDYWKTNNKAGISKPGISIDVLVLGAVSLLLSVGPYRIGKNEIIDYSIKNGFVDFIPDPNFARAFASGVTQLVLLPLWTGALYSVKRGIDYLDNKFEFKDKIVSFSKKANKNIKSLKTDRLPKNREAVIGVEFCPINEQTNLLSNKQTNL